MSQRRTKHKSSFKGGPLGFSVKQGFALGVSLLVIVVALILYLNTDWPLYAIWAVTLSVITLAMFGYDKQQAVQKSLRVPEIVLHGLALLGGWPGGWLGQQVFRHKTRERVFTVVFVISMLIHLGIGWYLFG